MSEKSLAILAGGLGTRATELTNGSHKSLIRLSDSLSIIERLLLQAKSSNIEKAYIVSDRSQKTRVYEEAQTIATQLNIETIPIDQDTSKFYGTMFAFALICSFAPKTESVITMEGDVVVSDQASKIIFSTKPNTIIIDDIAKEDCESMKVVIENGLVKRFSKQILGFREFCGISHLDHKTRKQFYRYAKNVTTTNPYYEEVFNKLVKEGVQLPYLSIPESDWNEIDNTKDYIETILKLSAW